ncbi:MAG: hypothetical protein SOZ00_04275 [Tidjanibacter sp.]|nr:hypothetical protein [Tidjanibacter sp.]
MNYHKRNIGIVLCLSAIAMVPFYGCNRSTNRNAEPIKVKVAVVYEDPAMPQFDNKRIHEYCTTPGYTYRWNDPRSQATAFCEAITKASHGVVEYEIVEQIEADRFFTSLKERPQGEHISNDEMASLLVAPKWGVELERRLQYDYNAMIQYYGFDKKRDEGIIDEVWIYSTPLSGAYESHLMGKGGFWLNSPPETETTVNKLLTVMFFNYERNLACALESFSHRFESTMMQVYGWWNYDNKATKEELSTWERYTGYAKIYDKYDAGNSNVGNVHFPPNGTHDYDFVNDDYVMSYADEWLDYPNVTETHPRSINRTEWGDHEGYMMWWLGHMPHFKGINSADGKLNNWWYYVVDYSEAVCRESALNCKTK